VRSLVSSRCQGLGQRSLPTPTWGKNANFCTARSSSTCGSGFVCAPHAPANQKLCLRLPGVGAGCPQGYDADPRGDWYRGYEDQRTCGDCSCSVVEQPRCTSYGDELFPTKDCISWGQEPGIPLDAAESTCVPQTNSSTPWTNPIYGLAFFATNVEKVDSGRCEGVAPTNGDPPTLLGGATICCR
jgi:hypothetical protein